MLRPTAEPWEPLPPRDSTSRQKRRQARNRIEGKASSESTSSFGSGLVDEKKSDSCKFISNKKSDADDEGNSITNNRSTNTANSSTAPQIPAAKRKPNRPGMNSYLKVLLDDATMDRLHGISKSIQTKVQALPVATASDDTNQENQQSKAKRNQQPLRFKARSRASLHMTFFFGGEALCELPVHELEDWYGKVRDRLGKANFYNTLFRKADGTSDSKRQHEPEVKDSSLADPGDGVDDEYSFDVLSISMFPPKRNNLVVAILEASLAWHTLYNDVRDIAKNCESQGLKDVTANSKDKWTAHITLGNIVGGGTKGEIRQVFNGILRQVSEDLALLQDDNWDNSNEREQLEMRNRQTASTLDNNCLFKARTRGITIGGPIPDQAELDWDFRYEPRNIPYVATNATFGS